jgi:hypothetical protein
MLHALENQKYMQKPSWKTWRGVGVFGLESDSRGGCRELHNEELHDLYSLPGTVSVNKPRMMRLMGKRKHANKILV